MVSSSGLVTGIAAGMVMITATASDNKTTATCAVNVWQNDGSGYLQYLCSDPTFYGYFWWHSPPSPSNTSSLTATATNHITVNVKKVSGSTNEAFGVHFFELDNNNYYKFTITTNGEYHFQKCVGGTTTELMPWTSNSAILGNNKVNTISIWESTSGQISVSVNTTTVISGFADSSFTQGKVSLYAANGNPTDSVPESFPGTPEDIRYQVTSPFTWP
jgi:hypothetical protein